MWTFVWTLIVGLLDERPHHFSLDDDAFEIANVEDRWYDPNAEYFKVRTVERKVYLLRRNSETNEWALQSGFDGVELLSRHSIELVSVLKCCTCGSSTIPVDNSQRK